MDRSSILRASTISNRQVDTYIYLPFISSPYRGESNSMQGANVKQMRSVCSEWARTPAGGRSRCGFAKQIRGFSAQCLSPKQMRCRSDDSRQCPRANVISTRGESNSMQGAGVKKTSQQRGWDALSQWRPRRKAHPGIRAQTGTWFPDGASSGNCDPEFRRRVGHAFPMAAQAESTSRNLRSEWDAVSK